MTAIMEIYFPFLKEKLTFKSGGPSHPGLTIRLQL